MTGHNRQAKIIRTARLSMGYSQQQVASLVGISIQAYQRLEYGERDISGTSMKIGLAVCAILGIDPLYLVFGGDFEKVEMNK